MNESDLMPGDILFFVNLYKKGGVIEQEYVDHVALFHGINARGMPELIHCISNEAGHYSAEKRSGLCVTTLRKLANLTQTNEDGTTRSYDVKFIVYRCREPDMAATALDVLKEQAKFSIPYDASRLSALLAKEDEGLDEKAICAMSEQDYATRGKFRSIKFAARHPLPLVRTRRDGVGKGLTCSMAVTLAYQIGELQQKGLVSSVSRSEDKLAWVSDKHSVVSEDVSASYAAYHRALAEEGGRAQAHVLSGYTFWQHDKLPLDDFVHRTMAVDCKTIGAAGLERHLQTRGDIWVHLGELTALPRTFSSHEKAEERARREADYFTSLSCLTHELESRETLVSESPSSAPVSRGGIDESTVHLFAAASGGGSPPPIWTQEILLFSGRRRSGTAPESSLTYEKLSQ